MICSTDEKKNLASGTPKFPMSTLSPSFPTHYINNTYIFGRPISNRMCFVFSYNKILMEKIVVSNIIY